MEKTKSTINTTQRLTETALMIALATVLAAFPIVELPMGGSVTVCSMLPIIILSYRYGTKWGLTSGLIHGIIQMMFGLNNFSYVASIGAYFVVAFADYLFAFGFLGLGGVFKKIMKNQSLTLATGTVLVSALRFLCHFLSGVTVWADYADGWKSVWHYSFAYNGSYMLVECIVTAVVAVLLSLVLDFDSKTLIRKKK